MTGLSTFFKDLQDFIPLIFIQMMDTVSIIPKNSEIFCCRCQCRKTSDNFIRIGITLWVGILRYTPDSLDCRIIIDIFFYHVHIRSILMHRDCDQIKTKSLCNLEMTVIARCRTKEFHLVKLAPWCMSKKAEHISSRYCIIHHIQTGVTKNHNVIRIHFSNRGQQSLCFRNTIQYTIISAVCAIFTFQIRLTVKNIHHSHGKIQLCDRRLASGHIQLQPFLLVSLKFLIKFFLQREQFFSAH